MPEWHSPSNPVNIQARPWLSGGAIRYLETLLKPNFEVLEFGAGGSTLWLAERVRYVATVENNPSWRLAVAKKTARDCVVVLESLEEVFQRYFEYKFDLLFIDGEPVEKRALWLKAVRLLVKSGGYVVLDNANRPEYADARAEFQKHATLLQTINANREGFHYLVTEFYRCE